MRTIDVLMDYITCRCDEPQDKLYQERPPISDNPELGKFIEICFVPQSPMNEHLKEILFHMMEEWKYIMENARWCEIKRFIKGVSHEFNLPMGFRRPVAAGIS